IVRISSELSSLPFSFLPDRATFNRPPAGHAAFGLCFLNDLCPHHPHIFSLKTGMQKYDLFPN
ncbi:MAG: hypothetical protein IJQ89_04965, partial [Bacteroidales bacterium]|nr:hypothetical protein [Bacteroidales bacterium]